MESKNFVLLIFSFTIALLFRFTTSCPAQCPTEGKKEWSYDANLPNGPPHWGKKYPDCNGKSQSPIDIKASEIVSSGKRQKLAVEGYDKPIGKVMIMNNGHRIEVMPQDGVERSVTVDGKKYKLMHFHFHWGNKGQKGSEHEMNDQKSTMEVHLVHHDSDGKMVVVAGFLEEGNEINSALENILFVKSAYEYEGDKFEGEIHQANSNPNRQGKIYLEDLITENCRYYRYSGSIGFPPCTEGVTWLVCRNNKGVKSNQLNELFSLYSVKKGTQDFDKCHLVNIFRPVQPLNGRKIYK